MRWPSRGAHVETCSSGAARGDTWRDGSLNEWAVPTRNNSDLAAMLSWESLRCMEIYVYFQDRRNRIRELRFVLEKREWFEDSPTGSNHLKGLSGTSIACVDDVEFSVRLMCSQSPEREVQQCHYNAGSEPIWIVGTWPIRQCSRSLQDI